MEITVRIEAPALVDAIYALAASLGDNTKPIEYTPTELAATLFDPEVVLVPASDPVPPTVAPELAPVAMIPTPVAAPAPDQAMTAPAAVPTAVATAVATYTMEQLAVAATQLVDTGRRTELVSLLGQFGVPALTALPKDQYGAFATALRQMGAKI